MNYIECSFKLIPYEPFNELLIAELSDNNFESFLEEDPYLKAYIPISDFKTDFIKDIPLLNTKEFKDVEWSYKEIQEVNWNKKWESSFDAIEIGNFCTIRAPFHPSKSGFKFEIIIEPKMSFGTGHHATTQLMLEEMEKLNFNGKTVLDMGSGTAILSILAEKLGAKLIHAIDIDKWAYENMQENIERNNCSHIKSWIGGVERLHEINTTYDYILANINKNVLTQQLKNYVHYLNTNGELLISGFFEEDVVDLEKQLNTFYLKKLNIASKNKWSLIRSQKSITKL